MNDMLEDIFKRQMAFQKKVLPLEGLAITDTKKQKLALFFIGHTIEELIELRREFPLRKNWSITQYNNPVWSDALMEYVDALHFFVNIALVCGWSAEEVYSAYVKKNEINKKRQLEGY